MAENVEEMPKNISDKATTSGGRIPRLAGSLRPLALLLATIPFFARAEPQRAYAGDANQMAPVTSSPARDEAKRAFLKRYAEASARLMAGLSHLHGKGRFRVFRPGKTSDWTKIEFFIDDGKIRLHRDHGATAGTMKPPDALLLTPETAATVLDPGTKFASLMSVSNEPNKGFSLQIGMTLWRFLRSGCAIDAEPLYDCIADGKYVLESVEPDPENNGWLHVRCQVGASSKKAAPAARGTVDAWIDEDDGFVIRKSRLVSREPFNFQGVKEVGPFASPGNGARLPKTLSLAFYNLETASPEPLDELGTLRERTEFELLGDVETADIPDSYFTLQALGVGPAPSHWKLWLLVAVSTAVLLAAACLIGRRRASGSASTGSDNGASKTDVCQ